MIVAGTGHRKWQPDVARQVQAWIREQLQARKPVQVISGMALGFDTWLVEEALRQGIPFVAAVPFEGQEWRWPRRAQERYQELIQHAAEVQIICQGPYSPKMFQVRNEWMVDRCDLLLAAWTGEKGGTANCTRYAQRVGREIAFAPYVRLPGL